MPGNEANQLMAAPVLRSMQQQLSRPLMQETLLARARSRWVECPACCPTTSMLTGRALQSLVCGVAPNQSLINSHCAQAFHAAGWTREAVLNVPNALSLGRLISGPFVAYLILEGHWAAALGTLTVAGAVQTTLQACSLAAITVMDSCLTAVHRPERLGRWLHSKALGPEQRARFLLGPSGRQGPCLLHCRSTGSRGGDWCRVHARVLDNVSSNHEGQEYIVYQWHLRERMACVAPGVPAHAAGRPYHRP